jgi:hypothetical protein
MAGFGDKLYGLADVKVTNLAGTTQVDLPNGQSLQFTERINNAEMKGDDALVSVVGFSEAVEWTLNAGGISLEAYALLTGRTASAAGTTPSRTVTLTGDAGQHFPYVKIYGKSVGDLSTDDIHCKLYKCKLTAISGTFGNDAFFVTAAGGVAITDGVNGVFTFIQHETAATLPTS